MLYDFSRLTPPRNPNYLNFSSIYIVILEAALVINETLGALINSEDSAFCPYVSL